MHIRAAAPKTMSHKRERPQMARGLGFGCRVSMIDRSRVCVCECVYRDSSDRFYGCGSRRNQRNTKNTHTHNTVYQSKCDAVRCCPRLRQQRSRSAPAGAGDQHNTPTRRRCKNLPSHPICAAVNECVCVCVCIIAERHGHMYYIIIGINKILFLIVAGIKPGATGA